MFTFFYKIYRAKLVQAQILLYDMGNGTAVHSRSTGIDWYLCPVLFCLIYFIFRGHYTQRRSLWEDARDILIALFLAGLIDMIVMANVPRHHELPLVTGGWVLTWLSLVLVRYAVKRGLAFVGLWQIPTAIVGTGSNAVETFLTLRSEPLLGFEPHIFVEPRQSGSGTTIREIEIGGERWPVAILPETDDDPSAVLGVRHWVVAVEKPDSKSVRRLISRLSLSPSMLHIVPPMGGASLYGMEIQYIFGRDLLLLKARNNLAQPPLRFLKQVLDPLLALILTIVLLPVFLTIAALILRSGGHVLFGQERLGKNGRRFTCYKFRTMYPNSDRMLEELLARDPVARQDWETKVKLRNDPRVTPIGRVLRKTSLDELPQLINILIGDMSLVGPRPMLPNEIGRYGDVLEFYFQVKPGLTGLWQTSGRANTDFSHRVYLDSWYVRNWSLWYDFVILAKTLAVVLAGKGAY